VRYAKSKTKTKSKNRIHLQVILLREYFYPVYEAITYGLQAMIPDGLSIAPNLLWKGLLKV
jgi:hypothetical protein